MTPLMASSPARSLFLVNFPYLPYLLYKGYVGLGQKFSKRSSFSPQSKHPAQNPTLLSPLPQATEEKVKINGVK